MTQPSAGGSTNNQQNGIVSINKSIAETNRQERDPVGNNFYSQGLDRAYEGSSGAIFNHKAKWKGYSDTYKVPLVEVYGRTMTINQIHGYKGIPLNTPVTLRVSRGFKTIDFQ